MTREENGLSRGYGARVKMPVVGWEQPGPAEHVACAERLNGNDPALFAARLQRHFALENQIKTIRPVTFLIRYDRKARGTSHLVAKDHFFVPCWCR